MRILVGDRELEFTDKQLDTMFIDEGTEAEVFYYKNSIFKIYKPFCRKIRLKEEDAERLRSIKTSRILLPKEIIRDADTLEFKGYTEDYIERCSTKCCVDMRMDHFISELSILESDLGILSRNNVNVEDFHLDNMLYNGSINFCDPGSFEFRTGTKSGRILSDNISQLNDFVLNDLFMLVKAGKKKRRAFNDRYVLDCELSWQLEDDCDSNETVKHFVKRMTR